MRLRERTRCRRHHGERAHVRGNGAARDRYGIRAWSTGGQVLLNDLQTMIVTSSANGGGWVPIVLHEVCSQTFAPDRYTACTGTSGWMELDTLNGFLDWMAQAGQPGGGPAGSSIATVRQVMGA